MSAESQLTPHALAAQIQLLSLQHVILRAFAAVSITGQLPTPDLVWKGAELVMPAWANADMKEAVRDQINIIFAVASELPKPVKN